MPKTLVQPGVEIEYETFGSTDDPAMVVIAGFGAQLLSWHDRFCRLLADEQRLVIRFDNRDCGLSTRFDDHPVDLGAIVAAASSGDLAAVRAMVPYTLHDMAGDVVGLLDRLGIERAHVVGASMGGMIAQLVAIEHPDRTASLTSMMSSTGESEYGQSTPAAGAALFGPTPADRDGYVAGAVAAARVWGSRRYFDPDAAAALASAAFDRGHSPEGTARQLGALLAAGSLADGLRTLTVPTLVIHGLDDTLVTPSGGRRTASLVPGSELMLVRDMGHDRPEPLWPLLRDALVRHSTNHP